MGKIGEEVKEHDVEWERERVTPQAVPEQVPETVPAST